MRICSRSQSSFHIMLPTIMEPAAVHLWSIRRAIGSDYILPLRWASWFVVSAKLVLLLRERFHLSRLFARFLSFPPPPPPPPPSLSPPLSAVKNATVGDRYLTMWRNHIFLSPPHLRANSIWSLTFQSL